MFALTKLTMPRPRCAVEHKSDTIAMEIDTLAFEKPPTTREKTKIGNVEAIDQICNNGD